MESNGIIRGFQKYTPSQLEQMKQDLGLYMSLSRIVYCAEYYRNAAHDPLIDELKLLDRFVSTQSNLVSSYAPISMMTNDEFVAKTFSDMMQKRKILSPNASYPCTLSETFGLATAYLSYAGKPRSNLPYQALLENKAHIHRGNKKADLTVSGARYGLRLTKIGNTEPSTGDFLVLLLPDAGKPHTQNGALQKAMLEDEALSKKIIRLATVGEGGLLRTLLSLSDGLWIDLTRLSRTGERVPLSMLADGFVGYDVARVATPSIDAFCRAAKSYGVSAMPFAKVTDLTSFTVTRGSLCAFSLDSGFLKALVPIKTADVRLENESNYLPAKITHTPLSKKTCKYLSNENNSLDQLQVVEDTVVAIAAAEPESGYFRNTVECVLVPILTLAASGCPYSDVRLAAGLSMPLTLEDETVNIAPQLSTLLGLYRVLAELGIPLAADRMDTDQEAKKTHLTVFGMSQGKPIRSTFSGVSNYVHCVTPTTLPDGLPDFTALRAMLTWLVDLNRSGKLVSARVIARESLTDALAAMSTDTVGCNIQATEIACEAEIPLTVLLESTEKLDAFCIGETVERHVEKTPEPIQILPQKQFLLANAANEILIVSQADDAHADVLETVLSEKGGNVTRATVGTTDIPTLCRAILSSKTVILCTNAALPKSAEVGFAIETFSRAGGWILLPSGIKCGYPVPVITLKNGINEHICEQICKK